MSHSKFGEQPSGLAFTRLMRHIGPCARALEAVRATHLAGTALDPPGWRVMEVLGDYGPRSVPGLASFLQVTRQAVQPLVDARLAAGHAERLPNPARSRSPNIRLTEAGLGLFQEIREREGAFDARMSTCFLASDVVVATRTLENLIYAYTGNRSLEAPRLLALWEAAKEEIDLSRPF